MACAGLQAQLDRKRDALCQVTSCCVMLQPHHAALSVLLLSIITMTTTYGRFDDMWLLSNVHIEDVGMSRKWVNWRDLYYPGGFIKCFPAVLCPPLSTHPLSFALCLTPS